jgi:hypothetical protein
MFWCTTALMHYSSELFTSHFRCTMSWNIDAELVVSTNLMGGDSAHSDQDGSLWLNPVLMHSSCSLDLSSFKLRGYPCHGVMACSTSQYQAQVQTVNLKLCLWLWTVVILLEMIMDHIFASSGCKHDLWWGWHAYQSHGNIARHVLGDSLGWSWEWLILSQEDFSRYKALGRIFNTTKSGFYKIEFPSCLSGREFRFFIGIMLLNWASRVVIGNSLSVLWTFMEWASTVQHLQAVAFHDEWRQFFQSLRGDNKSEMELVNL